MDENGDFGTIRLKVAKVKQQKQAGKSIAIIDFETMKILGVKVGEVVKIVGKKITAAKIFSVFHEDKGLGLVRIDGLTRKNCDASINDFVTVKRTNATNASSIKLSPTDIRISVSSDFIRLVKDRLIERPCIKGDVLLVVMDGHAVHFLVHKTEPDGIVKIASTTDMTILSEPTPP